MATQAQFDANRLNAQKSTGPATDEGKARSRFNALKHGIYASEVGLLDGTANIYSEREQEYLDHFQPQGPEETYHLEIMLTAANEQDRLRTLDGLAFRQLVDQLPEDSDNPLGEAVCLDAAGANCLEKLHRRREAAHRRWLRSSKMLKELQTKRLEAKNLKAKQVAVAQARAAQPQPAAPAPQPEPPTPSEPQNIERPAAPSPAQPVPIDQQTR